MFAIPKGWPFANVFSVGDVIIVIAVAYLAHAWCRRPVPLVDSEQAVVPELITAD